MIVIMGLGMFIVDSVLSSLVDSKVVLASLGVLGQNGRRWGMFWLDWKMLILLTT